MEREAAELLKAAIEELSTRVDEGDALSQDFTKEDLSILYALAHSLYQIGDYDQARRIFQQLILAKPMDQKHWIGLGSTLQMEKNYSRALTAWGMAALLIDEDPIPHFHAAECLLSLGQIDEALKAFQSAKQRIPKDREAPELKQKIEAFQIAWRKIKQHEESA